MTHDSKRKREKTASDAKKKTGKPTKRRRLDQLHTLPARAREKIERAECNELALFLRTLAATGNIAASCRASGMSRRTAYNRRERYPDFAQLWDDALEDAIDLLEESAMIRAKDGLERLKFSAKTGEAYIDPRTGEPYIEREYSDTLTLALLKAHRPEKYLERNRLEVAGKMQVEGGLPPLELLAAVREKLPGLVAKLSGGSDSEEG